MKSSIVALAAVAALTAACGNDADPVSSDPTRAVESPSQSTDSPTDSAPTPGTATVPLYYVGDTPQGPRLFREFRQVPGVDAAVGAINLLSSGDPLDPDYRSLVAGGGVESVEHENGAIVITLPDESWVSPGSLSEDEGALAAQQVVFTVQGVLQSRDPVEVRVAGSDEATFLFGVDTDGGLHNDSADLAQVNVTTPEQGSSVSGTLKASGVADSFEATVPWQIVDSSGSTVLEGSAMAHESMKLSPWSTSIDVSSLPPGKYTFIAATDDPSGGEGFGPTKDSKEFAIS